MTTWGPKQAPPACHATCGCRMGQSPRASLTPATNGKGLLSTNNLPPQPHLILPPPSLLIGAPRKPRETSSQSFLTASRIPRSESCSTKCFLLDGSPICLVDRHNGRSHFHRSRVSLLPVRQPYQDSGRRIELPSLLTLASRLDTGPSISLSLLRDSQTPP